MKEKLKMNVKMEELTETIDATLQQAARMSSSIAHQLQASGAIDPSSPYYCKVIVCATLRALSDGYIPLTKEGKRELANLSHF